MNAEVVLILGGAGALALALTGIVLERRDTPIRALLNESERRSLDTQYKLLGQRLCPNCELRYTTLELCFICAQVELLETPAVGIASEVVAWSAPLPPIDRSRRFGKAYSPLWSNPAFADLFQDDRSTNE